MDTDKHGHPEVITDLHIKLPENSHQDLLEVKIDGGVERCTLPLRAYGKVFPNNFTTHGLPKPDALQAASHIILESYTDGILPAHGEVILNIVDYKTGMLMPIRFFIVDIKNEVIISSMVSTQPRVTQNVMP